MALAHLCSRLRREHAFTKIADNPVAGFHALIVNHQLRDGSLQEAKAVAAAVNQLGIKAQVCDLCWHETLQKTPYTHPKHLPNFETIARRLRYQAIGKYFARMSNVLMLFLAHHQDDQYETVLMRLMSGKGPAGLRGMRPATDIPECHEIHCAYQSGYVDDQRSENPMWNFRPRSSDLKYIQAQLREDMDPVFSAKELADGVLSGGYLEDEFDAYVVTKRPPWGLPATPLDVEDGGMMIYRPLLEFSKDRLIATCEANGVPWFEDATNSDPTLTPRNAIRHLCKYYNLPMALQKPAILGLSDRLRRKAEADEAEVDRLLARTIIRDFDSTSGTVVVRLPTFRIPRRHRVNKEGLKRRIGHYRRIAALLVKRLMAIVTPNLAGSSTSDLQGTVLHLFPSLNDDPSMYPEHPKAYYIAEVHFLPVWTSKKGRGHVSWYLSRAPYVSSRQQPLAQFSGLALNQRWRRRPDQWRWPPERPFQLWDGRFWLRLINRSSVQVGVMPFDAKDAKAFRKSLPPGRQQDQVAALLKFHAPGKVRWTLPAIYATGNIEEVAENYERHAQREKSEMLDGADAEKEWEKMAAIHGRDGAHTFADAWEREMGLRPHGRRIEEPAIWQDKFYNNPDRVLVALPTLGLARPGLQNWIKCEMRYKKVDRRLLEKSAKNESDLARYERARRRASKTCKQVGSAKHTVKCSRRPATSRGP